MRIKGGMLLEMLLMVVIIASLLPFMYRQNVLKNENLENAAIAADLTRIKTSVENYLESDAGLDFIVDQVYDVDFDTLYKYGLPASVSKINRFSKPYYVKVKKTKNPAGNIYLYGYVFVPKRDEDTVLKSYDTLKFTGPVGGVLDDGFIVGAGGSWMESAEAWEIPTSLYGAVFVRITPEDENHSYIVRNGNVYERTMLTSLLFLHKDIKDIAGMEGNVLTSGTVQVKSVGSQLSWVKSLIFGEKRTKDTATEIPDGVVPYIENVHAEAYVSNGLGGSSGTSSGDGDITFNPDKELTLSGLKVQVESLKVGTLNVLEKMQNVGEFKLDATSVICESGGQFDKAISLIKTDVDDNKLFISETNVAEKQLSLGTLSTYRFVYDKNYILDIDDLGLNNNSYDIKKTSVKLNNLYLLRLNQCLKDAPNCPLGQSLYKIMKACQESNGSQDLYNQNYPSIVITSNDNFDNTGITEIINCLKMHKELNKKLCAENKINGKVCK